MKLRNKKTGEIVEATDFNIISDYNSLAELNADWEDYEEPERFYWIDYDCKICNAEIGTMDRLKIKEIGNYFNTREEAEKAVDKLKAWKRLKDKGFKFDNFVRNAIYYKLSDEEIEKDNVLEDLDLLFGGEE